MNKFDILTGQIESCNVSTANLQFWSAFFIVPDEGYDIAVEMLRYNKLVRLKSMLAWPASWPDVPPCSSRSIFKCNLGMSATSPQTTMPVVLVPWHYIDNPFVLQPWRQDGKTGWHRNTAQSHIHCNIPDELYPQPKPHNWHPTSVNHLQINHLCALPSVATSATECLQSQPLVRSHHLSLLT